MIRTVVREVSDGEELVVEEVVVEGRPATNRADPRERTVEIRKLAAEGVVTASASKTPQTEGLTTLDRERAASIADEGGASAAAVETQERKPPSEAAHVDLDDTPPFPKPALQERRT